MSEENRREFSLSKAEWMDGASHNKNTRRQDRIDRRRLQEISEERERVREVDEREDPIEDEERNVNLSDRVRDNKKSYSTESKLLKHGRYEKAEHPMLTFVKHSRPKWLPVLLKWAPGSEFATSLFWTRVRTNTGSLLGDLAEVDGDFDRLIIDWMADRFRRATGRLLTRDVGEQMARRKAKHPNGTIDGSYRLGYASRLGIKDIATMAMAVHDGHILSFSGFVLAVLSKHMMNGINWADSPVAFAVFHDLNMAIQGSVANMLLRMKDTHDDKALSAIMDFKCYYDKFVAVWNSLEYSWNEWIERRKRTDEDDERYAKALYAWLDVKFVSIWPEGLSKFIGEPALSKPDSFNSCRRVVRGDAPMPIVESRVSTLEKIFNVKIGNGAKSLLASPLLAAVTKTKIHHGDLLSMKACDLTLIYDAARAGFDVKAVDSALKLATDGLAHEVLVAINGMIMTEGVKDVVSGERGVVCAWKDNVGIDAFSADKDDIWHGIQVIKGRTNKYVLYVFGNLLAYEPLDVE